jgi:pyrroloquinoline quinone biosynthesis protein B
MLDELAPVEGRPGLDGVLLTHAHIGHYLGLAQLGHEVLGATAISTYAMPRMADFLRNNGPWSQLVRYKNIEIKELRNGVAVQLNSIVSATPFLVPHRQEYSEVVGYRIEGPRNSVLFIPDIDSWEEWDELGTRIEEEISKVDVAYLDATFFSDQEIPGRDMSGFPHPFISHSMKRFADLPASEKSKVRLIHLNHTNPVLEKNSPERKAVEKAGFRVAEQLERFEL